MLEKGLPVPMDAQTLAEFLKLNPHIGAESRDDEKCKAFLGEFGMLELFTRVLAASMREAVGEDGVAFTAGKYDECNYTGATRRA